MHLKTLKCYFHKQRVFVYQKVQLKVKSRSEIHYEGIVREINNKKLLSYTDFIIFERINELFLWKNKCLLINIDVEVSRKWSYDLK